MAVWRYLVLSVQLQKKDSSGNYYNQDYDFPMFQYNFSDEKVLETGNLVDANFSDNGVEAIPLQMTYNPIFYELQTQLQRSQYFSIYNGEILIDLGAIENDSNAQGSVNIIYNPPGTNMICSWDNLMNQTNANFRRTFGVTESKTKFLVKVDNKIGNDGVFQCVRNNLQGISPAQIVNSAGFIFLLNDKRDQYDHNPCLRKLDNWVIANDSDLVKIEADGVAVIKMRIHTTGQNADSQLYPILTRLGMGVLDGTFQQGGADGKIQDSELLKELQQLRTLPKGVQFNLSYTANSRESIHEGTQQLPSLAIGIPDWLKANFNKIAPYGLNTSTGNYAEAVSIALAENVDINTSNEPTGWVYGLMPPVVANSPSVSVGQNTMTLEASADSPVPFFGYMIATTGVNAVSINVSGIPFIGSAESSLGQSGCYLATSCIGFNPQGCDLCQQIADPVGKGAFMDPPEAYITYDATQSRSFLSKFFGKIRNCAYAVIKVASDILKTEQPLSINNPQLVKDMDNSVVVNSFSIGGPEQNFIKNLVCQHGIDAKSESHDQIESWECDQQFFVKWALGSNSVNYIDMYKASIAFDMIPDFVIGRINAEGIDSQYATMTLEVHPQFLMTIKDPSTFTSANDVLRNSILLDDVDFTEHSFDLNVSRLEVSNTSSGNHIILNEINNNPSTWDDITTTQNVRKSVNMYYAPTYQKYHVENTCTFGMPSEIPVDNVMTKYTRGTPFYIMTAIMYNINMTDTVNKSVTSQQQVSYYVLPKSMSTSSGSIVTEYTPATDGKNPSININASHSEGTNNILLLENIILNICSISRDSNPTQ